MTPELVQRLIRTLREQSTWWDESQEWNEGLHYGLYLAAWELELALHDQLEVWMLTWYGDLPAHPVWEPRATLDELVQDVVRSTERIHEVWHVDDELCLIDADDFRGRITLTLQRLVHDGEVTAVRGRGAVEALYATFAQRQADAVAQSGQSEVR